VSERVNVPFGNAPSLGSEIAPVDIVIFSDFECPYCGDFARYTFPDVKTTLIDTGKARIAYRYFPLPTHTYAYGAAQAAACADAQGKFWEYHDILYAHQDALAIEHLQSYARELGLDQALFDQCLLEEERASTVLADRALGLDLGVAGTPTFFLNGRKIAGSLTVQEFTAEVEAELAAS
jgi:protein-disulfide isomerase